MAYQFRPMSADDLPLAKEWLALPHVQQWWHDPETFEFVSGDLANPDLAQFIVAKDGRPFAYLQCYRISRWHDGFGPQPQGTRGTDQFIGEAGMTDRGHGSAFIRQFVEGLLWGGTPRIVVDPAPANRRAIRAYERAGFTPDREVTTPDGLSLLMVRDA